LQSEFGFEALELFKSFQVRVENPLQEMKVLMSWINIFSVTLSNGNHYS